MSTTRTLLLAGGLGLMTGACATLGTSFTFRPSGITVGRTTQSDLIREFGNPDRVGYDNGSPRWAYGYYHYSVFGASKVKDLDVIFDAHGVVQSYTYESSDPREIRKQLPAGAAADRPSGQALPAD